MKACFTFTDIGNRTAHLLQTLLERGESAVILGPRGVGKRYLLELVNLFLKRTGQQEYPTAAFGIATLIFREEIVVGILRQASGIAGRDATIENWTYQVMQAHNAQQPLRLFVTNLDSISKQLAHKLLTAIQTLVKQRVLVVVATGEGNVIDLVDGSPTSAWNCANQFVVHSHDHRHFGKFLSKHMRQMQLRLPQPLREAKAVVRRIFQLTGGDISLARTVLWSVIDEINLHFKRPRSLPAVLTLDLIPSSLADMHIVLTSDVVPFRYGTDCILAAAREDYQATRVFSDSEKSPLSLPMIRDLELMIWGDTPVEVAENPHLFELAGFARREDGKLVWFCEYAEKIVRSYFTKQRLGDFHAFAHRWDDAYRLYEQLPEEEKCRPLTDDDNVSIVRLLDGLAVLLDRKLSGQLTGGSRGRKVVEVLNSEVRRALVHLLGFSDACITCWERDWQGEWARVSQLTANLRLPEVVRNEWACLAAREEIADDQCFGHSDGYHWVICRNADNNAVSAILVDGRDDPLRDHPMRRAAAYGVFCAYRRARERQLVWEGRLANGDRQKAEMQILDAFWGLTRDGAWDTLKALNVIIRPLLECIPSINRLIFLEVVSYSRDKIQIKPLIDSGNNIPGIGTRRHFAPVEFSLSGITDIVSATGITLSANHANKILDGSGLAALMNDCMLVFSQSVRGFVLLESSGECPLSSSEMDFIKKLISRMKPIWYQAMRLKLLHESINANPSPSILLDRSKRILYANDHAIERLQLQVDQHGWQNIPREVQYPGIAKSAEVVAALSPSDEEECIELIDTTPKMAGVWLRECHPLIERGRDGKQPRGWVLTFRNRAFLFHSFGLIRKLETAINDKKALTLIAENVKKWLDAPSAKVRSYMIDKRNPGRLVGFHSIGLNDAHTRQFENGLVYFIDGEAETGWKCLNTRRPEAFKLCDHRKENETGRTRKGLEYCIINRTFRSEILEKELGDLSIDFPILSGNDVLGKLTINFSEKDSEALPPELPMQLGALSTVLGGLVRRMNREFESKEKADRAMAETAHNLVSQFQATGGYVARYRQWEGKYPELISINNDLERFLTEARVSIRRIKDREGNVILRPGRCDLAMVFKAKFNQAFFENSQWDWASTSLRTLPGMWDSNHWANLCHELAHNSLAFAKPGVELQITISLEEITRAEELLFEFRYSDNGFGVRDEFKEEIFFGKSHREDIGSQGGGVGLSYVRRVVEAHCGTVREIGEFGKGFCLLVQFPIPKGCEQAKQKK